MNRIQPNLPASDYQTYSIFSPSDRLVQAACHEVGCPAFIHGWETPIDERTELGVQQAAYIRTQSGRTFKESRTAEGLTVFRFDSGQRCFQEHQTRPEVYTTRPGDWRGTFGATRQHASAADWVEDFGEHQQTLADAIERG
jgi:hypothetical protein